MVQGNSQLNRYTQCRTIISISWRKLYGPKVESYNAQEGTYYLPEQRYTNKVRSQILNFFTKLMTKYSYAELDFQQSPEQAGFQTRKGTNDHLQITRTLKESKTSHLFWSLKAIKKPAHNTSTIFATASVRLYEHTNKFKIQRGI